MWAGTWSGLGVLGVGISSTSSPEITEMSVMGLARSEITVFFNNKILHVRVKVDWYD